ncbi:MAG: hypothetical protein K2I75_00470, partial [Clostridiales bacterium]|nr:hypothetical protein [Clostridiales bacterium]
RDVGKMCGSLATLTYLQRTRSGCFDVKDSVKLDELERIKEKALIPPQNVLDLPVYKVDDRLYDDMVHGRKIACSVGEDSLIYCNGEFFGIGNAVDGILKIKTYLRDDN